MYPTSVLSGKILRKVAAVLLLGCTVLLLFMSKDRSDNVLEEFEGLEEEDTIPEVSSQDLFNEALARASRFPFELYYSMKDKTKGCIKYPHVLDLEYYNEIWQVMRSGDKALTVYLFGAYFDDRPKEPVVRVIGVMNAMYPKAKVYCRMWFKDDSNVHISSTKTYNIIWNTAYSRYPNDTFVGQLIACPLPDGKKAAPVSVSLATEECGRPTNNLIVYNELVEHKKDFLVCVKALDFPYDDISVKLVEFIEANFMFGVDNIVFYDHQVHPNVRKVLQHYLAQGRIELYPFTLPAGMPNDPFLRHAYLKERHIPKIIQEVTPYNDCYYRNLHKYKWVLLLDVDEVFVPIKGNTYHDVLRLIEERSPNPSSIYFIKNFIFTSPPNAPLKPEVPPYLDMLQKTTIAWDYEKPYNINIKSFFSTQDVLTLNNHKPYDCLSTCRKTQIPNSIAQLNHYRVKCMWEKGRSCGEWSRTYNTSENRALWRFKDEFVNRTRSVLKRLKLIPNEPQ